MSFRDEINSVIKTPEEVLKEKESAEQAKIRNIANYDFEKIKKELKTQAQNGKYVVVGDYKKVSTFIKSDSLKKSFTIKTKEIIVKKGFMGSNTRIFYEVHIHKENVNFIDYYCQVMNELAKKEDISISICGYYEDTVKGEYIWPFDDVPKIPAFCLYAFKVDIGVKATIIL